MADLRGPWECLAPAGDPLAGYDWFASCAEAFAGPDDLRVTVVRDHERVVGIAPLCRVAERGVSRLHLLGARPVHEPGRLLFDDGTALRALVDAVLAAGRPLLLGRLAHRSAELGALSELPRRRALVVHGRDTGTPRLRLPATRDALERAGSPSRRSALRRAWRRAEAAGAVHLDMASPDVDTVEAHVEELVGVEARGWKGRAGTALLHDGPMRRFVSLYARRAAAAGALRMSFLRIDGVAAAAQLAVEAGGALWVLKIGYDEAWARTSPGILLTHWTMGWCVDRGLDSYEFLGTDAPWIRTWTSEVVPHRVVRVYPRSRAGLAGLAVDAVAAVRPSRGRADAAGAPVDHRALLPADAGDA